MSCTTVDIDGLTNLETLLSKHIRKLNSGLTPRAMCVTVGRPPSWVVVVWLPLALRVVV